MNENLILFIMTSAIILITPGPSSIFIISRTLNNGKLVGLVSALGVSTGLLVHVLLAFVGFSKMILLSLTSLSIIKFMGALFIIYLGVRMFREPINFQSGTLNKKRNKCFFEGFLLNFFNPKNLIFFLSLLPQFVTEGKKNFTANSRVLSIIFLVMALIWGIILVFLANHYTKYMNPKIWRYINKSVGVLFVVFGIYMLSQLGT